MGTAAPCSWARRDKLSSKGAEAFFKKRFLCLSRDWPTGGNSQRYSGRAAL
jgi:hypothetical protein